MNATPEEFKEKADYDCRNTVSVNLSQDEVDVAFSTLWQGECFETAARLIVYNGYEPSDHIIASVCTQTMNLVEDMFYLPALKVVVARLRRDTFARIANSWVSKTINKDVPLPIAISVFKILGEYATTHNICEIMSKDSMNDIIRAFVYSTYVVEGQIYATTVFFHEAKFLDNDTFRNELLAEMCAKRGRVNGIEYINAAVKAIALYLPANRLASKEIVRDVAYIIGDKIASSKIAYSTQRTYMKVNCENLLHIARQFDANAEYEDDLREVRKHYDKVFAAAHVAKELND